ncbi:helix-turn-helix domain-containing protein [bacterium]|nr:helix-turn-helix domain-containing protein [bacterium]
MDTNDYLMTTREVANLVRRAEATVRHWRWSGDGPPFISVGRGRGRPMYRRKDVEDWLDANTVRHDFGEAWNKRPS